MLTLTVKFGDREMTIHPTVVYDGESWTLVDTGMPGHAGLIRPLVQEAGLADKTLQAIILTHQDIDHIGGLPGFFPDDGSRPFEVFAHEDDKDAIDGKAPFVKFTPERAAQMLPSLPEAIRIPFENTFLRPTKANVTRLLVDGETLPIAGGLTVIHTPGHTPGHVSLYHRPSKTLIAGDAMVVQDGELHGPRSANTPNMEQALDSLNKFKAFDIEAVVCFHGGLIRGDLHKRIAELTDRP